MAGANSRSFTILDGCSYHISIFKDDTSKPFPGRLYVALTEAGFLTLQDNQMIERIQQSNIAIIIFTKDYVSSEGHLDEVVNILDLYGPSRIVPVYYCDVDRSDVRHQLGSDGEAFPVFETGHEDDVNTWREALKKVAKIPGYNVGNVDNGSQSKEELLIKKIVMEMGAKVKRVVCPPESLPVGLDSRANSIITWLKFA